MVSEAHGQLINAAAGVDFSAKWSSSEALEKEPM